MPLKYEKYGRSIQGLCWGQSRLTPRCAISRLAEDEPEEKDSDEEDEESTDDEVRAQRRWNLSAAPP